MYVDPTRTTVWQQLTQRDFRIFAHLLTPQRLRRAAAAAELTIADSPLNLLNLVWLALACAIYRTRSFSDVLGHTLKLLDDIVNKPEFPPPSPGRKKSKHDPNVDDPTSLSEEAFVQARQRFPWKFWIALLALLADEFEEEHRALLLWRNRFRLLCLDGTTLDLPNYQALAEHFGTAGRGQGRVQTQARLVLLQQTLARMPWRFDLTPLTVSEPETAARLLTQLRADDLVLMDRGFFTYRLFWAVQNHQAFFVTRQRKNVKLRTLRRLGRTERLVLWRPASCTAQKAIREQGLPTAMTLRVIDYRVKGFRPSAVVTNLLDESIAAEEFVRLAAEEEGRRIAAGLYHRRWEIEITFLELKVTQGLEGSLRSRTVAGIDYEVGGHLLFYQLLRWLLVEAAEEVGVADPLRLSYQEALEELGDLQPSLLRSSLRRIKTHWHLVLLVRIGSHEVPWRPNRHYARPHDTKAKAKGHGRYQPASKLEPSPKPKPKPRRKAEAKPKARRHNQP